MLCLHLIQYHVKQHVVAALLLGGVSTWVVGRENIEKGYVPMVCFHVHGGQSLHR